MIWYDFGMIE